ncbi:MAG: F0F1 ATP synthase subunit epsilon [Turicibacter sp.]|nr:F0F1 ATP synthase subunit epsilon [Turicibacter sp.]
MKLKVITPDITLFHGEAESINLAERTGSFSILNDHAPLITVVKEFVATIQTEAGEFSYVAAGTGTLKVLNNEVSLIIDSGVVGNSKDEAKKNLAQLRKAITEKNGSTGDNTIANLEIELLRMTRELGRQ